MLVPRVDADGNEVGGVPNVLTDAPLGTYLGWNVTAGGARPFHQGQICNYVGGMVPFARTAQERQANGDPRLSLEERYGKLERDYAKQDRSCNAGDSQACLKRDKIVAEMDWIKPQIPVQPD